MKRILLFATAMLLLLATYAQQVERQQVVLEIGTGVWCVYCPGAAMGANDLLNSGADVAVIKYHSGDMYTIPASQARISFYGITGFPTAKFDGVITAPGGNPNSSLYSQYLPRYNTRKSTLSSFELSFDATSHGEITELSVNVNKAFTYNGTNLVVHLVVTETHIPHNWFNQQYVKNVTRMMVPHQQGTPVNFSSGNLQTVNLNFSLNPNWKKENLEFIAFIQDMSTKEILQAGKIMFANFQTNGRSGDLTVCLGSEVTFVGQDQYNTSEWLWTFPGGYPETSTEHSPSISYAEPGVYDVLLTVSDGINSHTFVRENHVTVVAGPEAAMPAGPEIIDLYYVTTSDYTTEPVEGAVAYEWLLEPAEAGALVSDANNATVTWNSEFIGEAMISVRTIGEMCYGEFSDPLEVSLTNSVSVNEIAVNAAIALYPNPVKGMLQIHIPGHQLKDVEFLKIFDATGKLVWQQTGNLLSAQIQLDLSHLQSGVYFLSASVKDEIKSQRFVILQ